MAHPGCTGSSRAEATRSCRIQLPRRSRSCQLIKSREKSRDVPIIFLTAISKDEKFVFEGYSAGAVDYIFKPFRPEILRSKVTVFVDLFVKQREIERQGELLRASERRELELRHRAGMLEVEARHALIVDSAMDPIVTFGDDRRVRVFNTAAQRTFRISGQDAIGLPIERFLPNGIAAVAEAGSGDAPQGPGIHETVAVRADGDEFPAEYTLSTLQLAERSRDLEKAMGVRNRFYVERTLLAANHLLELVSDILDLSKVEAGKMELKVEPVVFPDLIEDLFATVTPLAEQHGVKLILTSCKDRMLSDPRRIRQILLNLLSNAIKFGDGKPVRVSCWRSREGEMVIEVRDQGPGIARDDQERIFEEFVQLEHQQAEGTGLGLPISRRLAELLGGSLTVMSRLGEGSAFRLALPYTSGGSRLVESEQLVEGRSA